MVSRITMGVANTSCCVGQNASMRKMISLAAAAGLAIAMVSCSSDADDSGSADAEPTDTQTISLETNRGKIVIQTNPDAPQTVEAQTKLVTEQYFDDTPCHRVVTSGIFVLQCGDPTGTGTGGPGYQLPDENLPDPTINNYPAGTVAMANSGPNTAGSQFFIVYEDTTLDPGYTIWGEVVEGLDVVTNIAVSSRKDGITDGKPKPKVTINTATLG
jgi:peptidyl-prolyl cis-trans isomerase B (cyclophilin B)